MEIGSRVRTIIISDINIGFIVKIKTMQSSAEY